jgi:uncharacterized protein
MQFDRELLGRVGSAAQHFPVVLLTGARQTGKTTLLRDAFPAHHYTSLDLPSDAALAENSPALFFAAHPPPVLIDEVQYAPGLFRHVKAQVDERRHDVGRFVLTGSQKFPLMKEVSDSLAGRCAWFELEGLSVHELAAGGVEAAALPGLSELLLRGQLPELWRDREIDSGDFWRSYLATYIERDVRQILNVGSLREFERFIRLAASCNGQLLNKTELARGIGVTSKTIDQWLSVLQASNQIELLEPYFANIGKRIVKSPKLYFCDTGLLCFLLGVDSAALTRSPWLGSIWEGFVYSELRKFRAAHAPEQSIWFYRDQQGREVDFLIQGGGGLTLIECKWTELPRAEDGRKLGEVAALFGAMKPVAPAVRCVIAARPASNYPLPDGTSVVRGGEIAAALRQGIVASALPPSSREQQSS